MTDDAWLALLAAATPGDRRWPQLLRSHRSADAVLGLSAAHLKRAGLSEDAVGCLHRPDREKIERWRAWLAGPRHRLITLGAPDYPPLLGRIDAPPLALWAEGPDPALLSAPQLAIVGSRNPTRSGRQTAEQFARFLSNAGLTITSGLAAGIDGAGHRGALQGGAATVAVLGAGPDHVFPRANLSLSREIAEKGMIVTEYPPGVTPRPFHFPQRNRIIAGLALGTLVVEANRRSGSLITARCATDNGREVFAIPGSIHNPLARGCHLLIRQGAKLVEDGADVLVELAPLLGLELDEIAVSRAPQQVEAPSMLGEPAYEELMKALDFSPTSIADLADGTGLTAAELSSMLLLLEMEGYVEALPGGRYARTAKRS